jgi:hypothetical protein
MPSSLVGLNWRVADIELTAAEEPTDEQKKWYDRQMGSRKVSKDKGTIKKPEETVHKYSSKGQGPLREAVLIAGIPYFIKRSFNEKRNDFFITVDPKIEEATKVLRPPFVEEYPYTPYEFKTMDEPTRYLQRALKETPDSILDKIKSLVRKFNDIDEKTASLLSADILGSYFQDRFSTVHYLIVVGDNGTGKSAFGDTFECLGYRAVNITNATDAFWFRIFGTNEPGQVTVVVEEFDRIDENSQVMAMLKVGYQPNAKVPRMNNENTRTDFYYPFCFKIMIGERSPKEDKARGLLDRSFKNKTYKGIPDYKIKEIRNPQGNPERQRLLDEIMDLRKLILMYRLVHFKDPLNEVNIGLDGRDEELCKPLLQLFFSLGASEQTQKDLEATLQHFLDIKNERKENSIEALIYPIVIDAVSLYGNTISTGQVWQLITDSLEGELDENNPRVFNAPDDSCLYRNDITKMICDKFGAEIKHRKNGNVFMFNAAYLVKMGKIYAKTDTIQTKLVADAGDAGDALLGRSKKVNASVKADFALENSGKSEIEKVDPLPETASPESPESPIADTSDIKYDCYECIRRKKKRFRTNDKTEYEGHYIQRHLGMPAYPGKADLEFYRWKAEGKDWEI